MITEAQIVAKWQEVCDEYIKTLLKAKSFKYEDFVLLAESHPYFELFNKLYTYQSITEDLIQLIKKEQNNG